MLDGSAATVTSQNARRIVQRANQLLIQDTTNEYVVLQPGLNGPLARSMDLTTLRSEFDGDLTMGGLPASLTNDPFKHQLDNNSLSLARRAFSRQWPSTISDAQRTALPGNLLEGTHGYVGWTLCRWSTCDRRGILGRHAPLSQGSPRALLRGLAGLEIVEPW